MRSSAALIVVVIAACSPTGELRRAGSDDSGLDSETDLDTGTPGPCPAHMALVDDRFCMDRYEASLQEQGAGDGWEDASPYFTVDERVVRATVAPDMVPQAYISGLEAAAACDLAGKRMCSSEEWLTACQGPAQTTWPYGDTYRSGACNDTYAGGHPVVDFFGTSTGIWDPTHMNDPGINQQPDTVAAGGSYDECRSDWGIFDLHGNLHEWVADAEGIFRGGFFADAEINGEGCSYRTTSHGSGYHDYSTGFRCCAEPEL